MDVDEALAVNALSRDSEIWEAFEVLAAAVRQLQAEQHEVACPSCGAVIRSRLVDQAERAERDALEAEVARLQPMEERARRYAAGIYRSVPSPGKVARDILGVTLKQVLAELEASPWCSRCPHRMFAHDTGGCQLCGCWLSPT